MAGRENSVIERFRKDLRTACQLAGKVDLNAPLNGADRHLNADEFFAVDGRFFIVEFKSSQHNLKDEERKDSACELCGGLSRSSAARKLHDRGHFASWGKKKTGGPLSIKIDIYRSLVCCKDVLPNCCHVQGITADNLAMGSDKFLQDVISNQAGLGAEEFKHYLKWLFNLVGKDGSHSEFPLVLFGYTYTDGVFDKEFTTYEDFDIWAAEAIAYAKTLDGIKVKGP